jgi:hypothetical protein
MTGGGDDDAITAVLNAEWSEFRTEHPGEPDITFGAPPSVAVDENAIPTPPPYGDLVQLRHGRYGLDLPTHEDRVREDQERLARRDTAYYGF